MSQFNKIVSPEPETFPLLSQNPSKDLDKFLLSVLENPGDLIFDDFITQNKSIQDKWIQFFQPLGLGGWEDLNSAKETIAKWIHENGITYNVNLPSGNAVKPWSLNTIPHILSPQEWEKLIFGLSDHAKLLNTVALDIYGEQNLLKNNILPPESIYNNNGYLRALHHVKPLEGIFLYLIAYDMAKDHDGNYHILNCRTQSPSGLGYILENRIIISRLFPEAFREMKIEHIASSYKILLDSLMNVAKNISDGDPKFVLLTPGSYHETYFEHAYLARYLGLPLVEGGDLTVREDKLYLKTLLGLERIHGVFRRQLDDTCDPLELKSDSISGIPGLIQAIRAGNVVVSNALGSGFLESPQIQENIPKIRDYLNKVGLFSSEIDDSNSQNSPFHTPKDWKEFSKIPVWKDQKLHPRHSTIRVYAIYSGNNSWKIVPGGLTRSYISKPNSKEARKLGGATHDTWVMIEGNVDTFSLLPDKHTKNTWVAHKQMVSSKSGENQFWLGRYTERCESMIRLARESLVLTNNKGSEVLSGLQNSVSELCIRFQLTPLGTVGLLQSQNVFTRTMISHILQKGSYSLLDNILTLENVILSLKDKLPSDHSRILSNMKDFLETGFTKQSSANENLNLIAIDTLDSIGLQLAALVGLQSDRMTRDLGWHLLHLGRLIERTIVLCDILNSFFNKNAYLSSRGFEFLLVLFDSTITYQTRYQRQQDTNALLDLLIFDKTNPRAIACNISAIQTELGFLPHSDDLYTILSEVDLESVDPTQVEAFSKQLSLATQNLSDKISSRFFAHATDQMLST